MSDVSSSQQRMSEFILLTSERLGLQEPSVIEKDFYVTQAIAALVGVKNDTFKLVFQGGTSLAKAHKMIRRMSEDCDFRLAYRVPEKILPKEVQRKLLRSYREDLVRVLIGNGFTIDKQSVTVRNEGRFITIEAQYPSEYNVPSSLKPFISFELFLDHLRMPTVRREISSLIKQTLGDKVDHPTVELDCMSVSETAAEKWVALTRRVITAKGRENYHDQSLVRHIYDLYMINHYEPLDQDFCQLVVQVVDGDRAHFKSHSSLYYKEPVKAIQLSLQELRDNAHWRENWNTFMVTMVFGDKPSYEEAVHFLEVLSQKAIQALKECDVQ